MNEQDNLWNNPVFKGMDPIKMEFIRSFIQKDKPKNIREAMPFLLANMNIAKKQNINFTSPEVQIIAEILSQNASPEEKARIKKMLSLLVNRTD